MGLEEEAVQKKHNRVMIYTIFWSLVFCGSGHLFEC